MRSRVEQRFTQLHGVWRHLDSRYVTTFLVGEAKGMKMALRVLLVEDSEEDATLVVHELAQGGYDVVVRRVDTADALMTALENEPWDLAIGDYTMPQFSGAAALALIRSCNPDLPFIFVSGTLGEDVAVAAMRAGAQDYLVKGNLKRLVPAVERELREVAVRAARHAAEARLAHLAYHDPLTELPNRMLLHDRLAQAVLAAQRDSAPLSLVVLDLDRFKTINDSLGHEAGDRVLQQCAARLRTMLRDVDTVARLGGDEFALLLPRTDAAGAERAVRKVAELLRQPMMIGVQPVIVDGSFGIACLPDHGPSGESLLQQADIAMYAAKCGQLGSAIYSLERDRDAHQRLALIGDLRVAIERGQIACEYQPIVDLRTGGILAVESLARWDHPERGRLMPADFIALAEQVGLIEPLTMAILDRALGDWFASSTRQPITVTVNLSARSLRDASLPDRITGLLQRHRVDPAMLVLELTEQAVMSDPDRGARCLARIRETGVQLAIDDFGSGYSSFKQLQQLPADVLKIDQSLVRGLTPGTSAIVRSAIELGQHMGLTVVAEGVESAAVRSELRRLGCDGAQGYAIAAPLAISHARKWVVRHHTAVH